MGAQMLKHLAHAAGAQIVNRERESESGDDKKDEDYDATEDVEEENEKKSPKKAKDPNAPKRPMTSYLLFTKAIRADVKEENPEMKTTEITKEMGRRWKALSEEEKEPYVKEAAKLKKKYE